MNPGVVRTTKQFHVLDVTPRTATAHGENVVRIETTLALAVDQRPCPTSAIAGNHTLLGPLVLSTLCLALRTHGFQRRTSQHQRFFPA